MTAADLTAPEMDVLANLAAEARAPLTQIAAWLEARPSRLQRVSLPLGSKRIAVILTDEEHRRVLDAGLI